MRRCRYAVEFDVVEHDRKEVKDGEMDIDGEQNELDEKGEVRKGIKKTLKINLNKETIPTLIKIMDEDFNNHKCGHCVTKGDYINELKRLAKARARKAAREEL